MPKRWTWSGVVDQQKKVHVTKSKVEGKGKNKTRVTIEDATQRVEKKGKVKSS